jgi:hypothetical protein
MTKPETLRLLMLLSALESWALSEKGRSIPAYLHDELTAVVDALKVELLA